MYLSEKSKTIFTDNPFQRWKLNIVASTQYLLCGFRCICVSFGAIFFLLSTIHWRIPDDENSILNRKWVKNKKIACTAVEISWWRKTTVHLIIITIDGKDGMYVLFVRFICTLVHRTYAISFKIANKMSASNKQS